MHLPSRLRARVESDPERFLKDIKTTPREVLAQVWDAVGIDDEHEDPDPWPCFCGQIWGCDHSLDVRLKGMLSRLTERQALAFMELQGIKQKQTEGKRRKLLGRFVPRIRRRDGRRGRRRRSENPVLNWFFRLVFDMPADRCEDFLYGLKLAAITFLDRIFRRPPIAARSWYLPLDAAAELLGRSSAYREPPAPKTPTIVCPGKPKVQVMAARRGEGTDGDSAEARANGRIGVGCFYSGDMRPDQLPTTIGRRAKHLRNGATVAGSIGVETSIQRDYAAAQAAERTSAA